MSGKSHSSLLLNLFAVLERLHFNLNWRILSCIVYKTGYKLKLTLKFTLICSYEREEICFTSITLSDGDLWPQRSVKSSLLSHLEIPFCYFQRLRLVFDLLLQSTATKENTCALVWNDLQTCYSQLFIMVSVYWDPLRDVLLLVVKMKMLLTFDLVSVIASYGMVWGIKGIVVRKLELRILDFFLAVLLSV